jgi:hypothetical protein
MNTDVKQNQFNFEAELRTVHKENRKIVLSGLITGMGIGIGLALIYFFLT